MYDKVLDINKFLRFTSETPESNIILTI